MYALILYNNNEEVRKTLPLSRGVVNSQKSCTGNIFHAIFLGILGNTGNTREYQGIPRNTREYQVIPGNTKEYFGIPRNKLWNTKEFRPKDCNNAIKYA